MNAPEGPPAWRWRSGNRVELLANADRFFPAMLAAIDDARHDILLEMYLVHSGRILQQFIAALVRARQRGVRVCLLFDGYGASGVSRSDRQQLRDAGVELRLYNPARHHHPLFILWQVLVRDRTRSLHRNHRKLLLIDGRLAFVGGAGLDDAFWPAPGSGWRDLMAAVRGPAVQDLLRLFAHTWLQTGGAPLFLPEAPPEPAGECLVRVSFSDARRRNDIRRAALKRIRTAERRVWLTTAYFLPPWRLRRALKRRARRGVDVRLLLPGPLSDHPGARLAGQRFYGSLLRHGVRIFEYQPRFIHQKSLLCDDWSTLGSCNFDRWNLRWNLELNIDSEGCTVASDVEQLFLRDLEDAREITADRWRQRPLMERLSAAVMGQVDLLVERLLQRRPREHRRRPPRP